MRTLEFSALATGLISCLVTLSCMTACRGQGGDTTPAPAPRGASVAVVNVPVDAANASAPIEPDIAAIGVAGTKRDIRPVAGKFTVIDVWATWCAPCKEVAAGLHDLAASHNIAVRTVEIEDADDPVAVEYLTPRGFGLPHLKVYDARGTLLGEKSGAASELLSWLQTLVPAQDVR